MTDQLASEIIDIAPADAPTTPQSDGAPPEPVSVDDAISRAFDALEKGESAKDPVKEEEPAKPEDKAEEPKDKPKAKELVVKEPVAEKPAEKRVAEKPTERAEDAERSSEGRKRPEPPARFLPDAKASWDPVPNKVKHEVERVINEYEGELAEYRKQGESLKPYLEMARQAGTTVDKALEHYVGIERMLSQDFGKGIAQIAQNAGLTPQQTIGHVLRAFGADPARLAQMFQQSPQQFAAPQPKAPAPPNPQVVALQQQVAQLQQQAQAAKLEPVVESFKASHPDFDRLTPAITTHLKSGVIEQTYGQGLAPAQKLEIAYSMAAALHGVTPSVPTQDAGQSARQVKPEGAKSIAGSPNGGEAPKPKRSGKSSIDEALNAAFARSALR